MCENEESPAFLNVLPWYKKIFSEIGMLQEVQVVMDAKVKSVNEDLAEQEKSLQVCLHALPCLYFNKQDFDCLVQALT